MAQQPIGGGSSGGGFFDWLQGSVIEIGDAAKRDWIRSNFPERIVDDQPHTVVESTGGNVDEALSTARQNRNLIVLGLSVAATGLLVWALVK